MCPLLISLIGPSGSGKTYSALRLATGIASERKGKIFGIDTESGRMLHYADKFSFHHVQFAAPFGSLDYMAAIDHCVAEGASTIVIDSMSHEHDGKGGVLERRDAEWESKGRSAEHNFTSWVKPKRERQQLLQRIVSLNLAFIFCFRAKEKIKPAKKGSSDRQPEKLGLQPIAGSDFIFEMMIQALLPAGCDGSPLWNPSEPAAKTLIKVPDQFRDLLTKTKAQLSEDTGAALARWASGGAAPGAAKTIPADTLVIAIEQAFDASELEALKADARALMRSPGTSARDKERITGAVLAAQERVAGLDALMSDREPGEAKKP
jgi:ABC-type dipeptide/oligopeptide/nickel transport system ATPase subunit